MSSESYLIVFWWYPVLCRRKNVAPKVGRLTCLKCYWSAITTWSMFSAGFSRDYVVVSEIGVTLAEAFDFRRGLKLQTVIAITRRSLSKYFSSFCGRLKTWKYMMDVDLFFFKYGAIHYHTRVQVLILFFVGVMNSHVQRIQTPEQCVRKTGVGKQHTGRSSVVREIGGLSLSALMKHVWECAGILLLWW